MKEYIHGAEPLFLHGDNSGCLLLHGGGGGTAWDLKEFAEVLHSRTGMTIWLPSLTGYGTKPEDLCGITLDDWLSDAHNGLDRLLETCERVYVVGHSMGGLLTLLLASQRDEVRGIVTWAAPIAVRSRLLPLLTIFNRIPLLRRAIPKKANRPTPEWLLKQGWIGYDWIPTSIGLAMHDGLRRLKRALDDITCPALIVQGSRDLDVSRDSAQRIHEALSSEVKEALIIQGAGHAMMNQDEYKNELFGSSITFIERIQQ
ncbi:MAG: alpha/beta fold hydrolase [Candidatus Thorarchaeota archaeon]|nr:MAG: alpha/beta fold hydrolase [Candidatus Thorarchaeota archaeon]